MKDDVIDTTGQPMAAAKPAKIDKDGEEQKKLIDMAAELCQEENRDDKYRPTTELPLTSQGNAHVDSDKGQQDYPKTSGDEDVD